VQEEHHDADLEFSHRPPPEPWCPVADSRVARMENHRLVR
jgi:hypothetical protein